MSHDLFAAFGATATPISQDPTSNIPNSSGSTSTLGRYGPSSSTQPPAAQENTDDDDFGDFEDASAVTVAPPPALAKDPPAVKPTYPPPRTSLPFKPSKPPEPKSDIGRHPFAGAMDLLFSADDDEYDAGADEMNDLATNPEAAMAYSKRVIAAQQAQELPHAQIKSPVPSKFPQREVRVKPASRDPNVLFDADDISDNDVEDSFGEFEDSNERHATSNTSQAKSNRSVKHTMPPIDLLSLEEDTINPPRAKTTPSTQMTKRTAPVAPRPNPRILKAAPTKPDLDDAWDDFEETAVPRTQQPSKPLRGSADLAAPNTPTNASKSAKVSQDQLPPTNIPPPAVLLSIFPAILATGDGTLFTPVSKLDTKQRQVLLSHPSTHQFLQKHLTATIVLARIIAGRKLRWKRDQILSQSMRIGPAAAGGKGGMKLTGVDRSEVAKEDREVLDVLRLWQAQVGKLRTAVAGANAVVGLGKLPSVPEIAEQMPIKTLRPGEGGMTAPQGCALCGLRREERVAKVDVGVEDSFGEWWVQGMSMHVLCRQFWDEHNGRLRSR